MTKEPTFRKKMSDWLSNEIVQWLVIVLFIGLTVWMNSIAYFLGILYVLLVLWARRWQWKYIGLFKPKDWQRVLLYAILYSFLLLLITDMLLTPIIEHYTGEQVDITSLDGIRGNFLSYVIFIFFMWVVAAFGEEFVYRGLMVERLAILMGNSKAVMWLAVFISSVLFGVAHQYQGVSGMISTGLVGFIMGVIFIENKNRLWLTILTHGIYDMIGITLIYFNREQDVYDLFKNMFVQL